MHSILVIIKNHSQALLMSLIKSSCKYLCAYYIFNKIICLFDQQRLNHSHSTTVTRQLRVQYIGKQFSTMLQEPGFNGCQHNKNYIYSTYVNLDYVN